MKKKLVLVFDIVKYYWKLLFLFFYLVITYWVWENRESIFQIILLNNTFPFHSYMRIVVNLLLILIGIIFLIGIIAFIRTPILLNYIMKRRFEKFRFTNSLGEYPKLFPKKKDKNKEHGVIYTFNNKGLSILDFERNVPQLQVALRGQIYELTYGKKNIKKILVYVMPKKHDTPNIIAPTSDYMTRNMINLLCVGRTGSGKSYGLLVILGSLVKFNENISVTICDYKKSSFSQFDNTENFYGYEDVPNGIKAFYKEFTERLEANDEQR